MSHIPETVDSIKSTTDVVSLSIVIGTVLDHLPAVSAILAIIWTCIRIYETETIQKILGRKK